MFIWRGVGILVPVIAFVCSLLAELITRDLASKEYWDTHSTPFSMAMLVAGGLIWAADLYFFQNPGRVLIDEQTGKRLLWSPKHDFFFLRMRWWGLVCVAVGIVVLLATFRRKIENIMLAV
jgi:hypothetical protein